MAKLKVYNMQAGEVGQIDLADELFAVPYNEALIHEVVVAYNANQRQGTKSALTRSEVRGHAKKPWRQKGTGRARQGSIRAPQWRGGGVVFGPTGEQNYSIKMNKKVRTLALKSALSFKNGENAVKVVDKFAFEDYKTKAMIACLEKLNATGKTLVDYTVSAE